MKNRFRQGLAICVAVMTLLTGFSSIQQGGQTEHLAIILVLDNSGSMKDSDPVGLRFTGARLFVSLVDRGDSVGLITFSTNSQVLTDGFITIESESDKILLLSSLASREPEGFTDLKAALVQAADMARGLSPTIILLTDGKPEIPNSYPEYEQEVLSAARSLGLPVIGIALTNAAQTPFLDQLAAETGGNVIPADNANDLLDAYLKVFGQIKDRTVIGEGMKFAPGQAQLFLDPGLAPFLEKTSFVVGKSDGVTASLIAPDGRLVTSVDPNVLFSLVDDPDFMVITVAHPQGGEWKVQLDDPGNSLVRAILHSRLRVKIVSPSAYYRAGVALPVVVNLLEESQAGQMRKIIGESSFSALITLPDGSQESLDSFYDDGTHGDQVAGDGNYTRLYVNTMETGQYILQVQGRKGSVPVETSARVEVIPFPTLVVDKPEADQIIRSTPILLTLHLEGGRQETLDTGQFIAHVISPKGEEQQLSLVEKEGKYTATFIPQVEGQYQILFESQAATYFGVPFAESVEVRFEVDIPQTLRLDPVQIQPLGCYEREVQLTFPLHFTSTTQEEVELRIDGLENFQTESKTMVLNPGMSQVLFELKQEQFLFSGVETEGRLVVNASAAVDVQPDSQVPVYISVPSIFNRCSREIGWGGGIAFVGILVIVLVVQRARKMAAPPLMTGTLCFKLASSGPGMVQESDLTALKRSDLTIGSDQTCDISLPELDDLHACLRAIKTENGEKVLLEPCGEVRKGYAVLHTAHLLEHGDTVRMGPYEIQYLSDTGV